MINIKKKIFFVIKTILTTVVFLTLILFLYATFFYEKKIVENEITNTEGSTNIEVENKEEETDQQEEINNSKNEEKNLAIQEETQINDSIFMTVGNLPITHSDVVNEIKLLLILNNESYTNEKRQQLQEMAISSIVKRNVKQIEVDKNNFFEFSESDLEKELVRLGNGIDVDLDTLKNIFASNDLDFAILEDQVKSELYWNSLIFQLFKNRITINQEEINQKLKLIQNNVKTNEYLISEIVINVSENNNSENEIKELIKKIEIDGFESTARSLSISKSSIKGGDLGWLNENIISEKIKEEIVNTPIGNLSEPITLAEGILIFKIRDKRKIKNDKSLEQTKNELVYSEKAKILQMYSFSHYDKLRRSVTVKFFND